MLQLQSVFGIFALLGLAWLMSENRRAVDVRAAAIGLAVTLALAIAFMFSPWMARGVSWLNTGVDSISAATRAGTSFVFGFLGGGPTPYEVTNPGAQFLFAFQALPVVLVVSALTTLLFYWGVLQPLIRGFSFLLKRTMGVSGAVGLSTAANIFLGMVEAPLFIKPYLKSLTRSELFMVMTGGMAGIAGTVFVLYAALLRPALPDASAHLLIASVIGAPAALLMARIMVPETATAKDARDIEIEPVADSSMDAIVRGTQAGLELFLSIIASIIVLVALVWLCNAMLGRAARRCGRRAVAAAHPRLDHGARHMAHGRAVGGGHDGGPAHGREDRSQRNARLSRTRRHAARGLVRPHAPHHDVRAVRLRQFRQPWDHDHRPVGDGAGAARGHHFAWRKVPRGGHADDVSPGRHRGRAELSGRLTPRP